jgi:TolB-like protein/DNA-binding winged helix-turn-helix (wHTH) protein
MASWHDDFVLGDWNVSPKLNRVWRGDKRVSIKHKSMAVLVFLADAAGEVVTRDEIMDAVWPGMAVTDDVLTQSIVEIRKALDDDAKHPTVIETVPRVGFRLIASVGASGTRRWPVRPVQFGIGLAVVAIVTWVALEWGDDSRNPVIKVYESPSIVVLPFENLSDDPENAFFAEGMSEEIRNLLTRIPNLRVIGRLSSHTVKKDGEELAVIGQRLGVRSVLEGTVRKSGDRVRISTQLTDISSGAVTWSESYERTMSSTDMFEIQDNVAVAIIDSLQMHISTNPTRGRPTENTEAWLLFLKARVAANLFEMQEAETLLLQATELDPDFAEAYEMLSFVYWNLPGQISVQDAQRRMGEAAQKAIALDPDLVRAQTYYQIAIPGRGMRLRTIEAFERAVHERPDDPWLLEHFTFLLTEFGYPDEALEYAKRLVEFDPLSELAHSQRSVTLFAAGRTDEALAALEFTNPASWEPGYWKWAVAGMNLIENRDEVAIGYFESWLQEHDYPDPDWYRKLVNDARDTANGEAYLEQRIPEIVAALADVDEFDWHRGLTSLYLYFGYLDRYFELVLATEPDATTWHPAGVHLWRNSIFRRLGPTAHPMYLEFVRRMGVLDVWERRGPPDFCDKVDGEWVCE